MSAIAIHQTRPSPARPSIEHLSSSVSTGTGFADDADYDIGGETVESLMQKLAIERRVQYGAEKMLDVIEKRGGEGEQPQIKARITAQLESANENIKALEAKLERLRGGSSATHRRRRPARLNGQLGAPLSSSASSSTLLSAGVRPRLSRRSAPDRDQFSPHSTPSRRGAESALASSPGSRVYPSDSEIDENERVLPVLRETAQVIIRRLLTLGRTATANMSANTNSVSKGKSPERQMPSGPDEAWDCMTRLAELFKQHPALLKHVDVPEALHAAIPFLADSATTRQRTAGYRLLRYMLTRRNWGKMIFVGVEWLIIRTFTRDAKAVLEREAALRLLRAVMVLPPPSKKDLDAFRHPEGMPDYLSQILMQPVPLRQGVVRAIVSAAENPDDAMHTVCMETLVEMALLDLECLLRADAFRVVLNASKDGPFELGLGITGLLCFLVNAPSTRHLLLPGSDLETILVGLTEEYGKIPTRQMQRHLDKLDHSVRNVGMLLGSWNGLLYMCMDDCRAIKSLISSLHVPMAEMRNALLDLFFSAFRIKAPSWTSAFLDGRRLTVYNRTHEASAQELLEVPDEEEVPQRLNIVDNYVAFLLAVFIEAGLLEALVALIQDETCTPNVSRKATLLLGEILQLANHTLPLQYAAQIQALPRLFDGVADFSKTGERNAALSALSSIDSLFRNNKKRGQAMGQQRVMNKNSVQESLQRSQRQVQQVKLRLGLQMDDKTFQTMINESGVLLSRDHTKWNYECIMELLQGPLLNPKRLDEVIKATKFIRRLFSFLHPFNNRFSSVLRTRPNHKWVKLACALLTTMLVNPEGQRFLMEDKLLKQIVECLSELDQYAGQPSAQPVFARDRLENTLTYGYFEMIGTLSKHQKGIQLMEKFKFFTSFYHLCELRSRDDIIKLIIECFDYSIDAHQRIVLSKALTSSYMETRLYATHHLGRLLHEAPDLIDWVLQLLITQLYDPAMEVCEVAVMYLEEACQDPVNLEKVVYLRPTLEHLGDAGANLFLRFMSTSAGFLYLLQAQYIDYELESWISEQNLLYVIEVETFVSKTIRPISKDHTEEFWAYESGAPTHFFGELTKTPEGCQYLREKGVVPELAEVIRVHGMEDSDYEVLNNVKAALWAIGNIGSTEGGLAFLEDEEIIDVIIEIAEQSPVLTMKGTAFFIIGLISSTQMGVEILEEYGWVSTRTPLGQTTGLCLPNDISRFAYIEPWTRAPVDPMTPPMPVLTGLEGEIMHMISNLSNYVLAAGAMNNLKRVRNRHPRLFSSTTLFHRAMRAISTNHFQAPVRRFILDLFDIELGPHTLPRLTHLERGSYSVGPPRPDTEKKALASDSLHGAAAAEEEASRRRAKSSPGPEPPTRPQRGRGLTVGEPPAPDIFSPTPPVPALPPSFNSEVDPFDKTDGAIVPDKPSDSSEVTPVEARGPSFIPSTPTKVPQDPAEARGPSYIPSTPSSATSRGPPISPTTSTRSRSSSNAMGQGPGPGPSPGLGMTMNPAGNSLGVAGTGANGPDAVENLRDSPGVNANTNANGAAVGDGRARTEGGKDDK